jgi:hypothetical protein
VQHLEDVAAGGMGQRLEDQLDLVELTNPTGP